MNQNTKRAVLKPPTQGTVAGVGITRLATAVTAAVHDLGVTGAKFFGKKVRVYNEDASIAIWVAFSSDGTPDISSATAGGASVTAGTVEANPVKLLAGTSIEVVLSKSASRYLHTQAASGTPVLCLYPVSSGIGDL